VNYFHVINLLVHDILEKVNCSAATLHNCLFACVVCMSFTSITCICHRTSGLWHCVWLLHIFLSFEFNILNIQCLLSICWSWNGVLFGEVYALLKLRSCCIEYLCHFFTLHNAACAISGYIDSAVNPLKVRWGMTHP